MENNRPKRWKDGYTIETCMKQMTSKETTSKAIKELVLYHVESALKLFITAYPHLTSYPEKEIK